ncbi:kinase-regulated stress-responsive transcription factor skn7 [Tulasnella sp. UAMH 9824]|nr:kinase-regulated stress-responsive transcription factor skn7 [Tulasnella sp. UAMH 9824]
MPKLDGIQATSIIRQSDHMTPIISITTNPNPDDIANYSLAGMNDILPKPFTRESLSLVLEILGLFIFIIAFDAMKLNDSSIAEASRALKSYSDNPWLHGTQPSSTWRPAIVLAATAWQGYGWNKKPHTSASCIGNCIWKLLRLRQHIRTHQVRFGDLLVAPSREGAPETGYSTLA